MRAKLMDAFTQGFSWFRYFSQVGLRLSTEPHKIAPWQWVVLGFFLFFACFYGLGSYPILDMNEGLYAEIAREMITDKHFIIPHLNGVPYLEKPPLLYWLIAFSYQIGGVNAWAARFIPAMSFALTAGCVFWAGQKFYNARTGFIAAMILFSSLVMLMIARTVFFDMLLTFCVSASLLTFYAGFQEKNNRFQKEKWWLISTAFLALSVLTKGFLTFFLLPAITGLFLFLVRADKTDYKIWFSKKNIALGLIIILPWHLMAMVSFPAFSYEYFINNQLLRFFNLRVPHDYHEGPFYFYIPRVLVYLLPWSIFLLAYFFNLKTFFSALKKTSGGLRAYLSERPFALFLNVWFWVMFVFFSLSGEKGDYYMILGIVPLVYGIADKVESWFAAGESKGLTLGFYGAVSALILACVISLLFYGASSGVMAFASDKMPAFLTRLVIFLIFFLMAYGLFFGFISYGLRLPVLSFLGMAGLMIPLMLFYLSLRQNGVFLYSQKPLADYVRMQYEHRPVYFYQNFEIFSSFVFYNREGVGIIDSHSADLYFGQAHAQKNKNNDNPVFISHDDFFKQAKKQSLYTLMKADQLKAFQKMPDSAPFCVVQRNGNVLLLSSAPEDCQAVFQTGMQKTVDFDLKKLKKT